MARVEFTYSTTWSLRTVDFDDLTDLAAVYDLLATILVDDRYFDVGLIFPNGRLT